MIGLKVTIHREDYNKVHVLTLDVELDVVGGGLLFGGDGARVDALVARPHILDDQAPLVRPLVVVDPDTRVADERVQPDRQRMRLGHLPPRHLKKGEEGGLQP